MLAQRDTKCVQIEDNQTTTTDSVNVDELAEKWVDLLFSNTSVLRLGNNKKVCKDRSVSKRKTPSPRK